MTEAEKHALALADGWRPIEEAAKDGTPIIGLDARGCMAGPWEWDDDHYAKRPVPHWYCAAYRRRTERCRNQPLYFKPWPESPWKGA